MNLLLINPPQSYPKSFFDSSSLRAHVPLGFIQIASVLRNENYKVSFIDAMTVSKNIVHESSDTIHFGADWSEIKSQIQKHNPDVVGITNPFTGQYKNAIKTASFVKEIYPEVPVIVGGPHASVKPNDFLLDKNIDYVIIGEAENKIKDLIECIKLKKIPSKIKGVGYKVGKKIFVNWDINCVNDLDSLPYPAYDLLDLERYFELYKEGHASRPYIKSFRIVPMITSRGCPYNCIFCSIHLHMGRKWRPHSVDYVINHIKFLTEKYKVEHISFEDDNINLNKERFNEILDQIIENKIKITWDTPNGVRADFLDEATILKAKKSGLVRLVVAAESGDQEVVNKIINKNINLKNIVNVAKICKRLSIDLHCFFLIGFPGETKQQIKNTLEFAYNLVVKYNVVPSISIVSPLFGTKLYDVCKEQNIFTKDFTNEDLMISSSIQQGGLIKTNDFDPDYLRTQLKIFYRKLAFVQLMKPYYLIKKFKDNPKLFLNKTKRLMNFAFSDKVR